MGEVWAAQRRGQLGFHRTVALKLLRGAPDPQAVMMFLDEAKATSALQHWAIVPTFDLGQAEGRLYMAMELVHGPSLSALLQRLAVKKTQLSPAVVAYLGDCIAAGLDYANDRAEVDGKKLRLVHRDISPHNILLDLYGHVKLTDFGVARTTIQDHQSLLGEIRGKASYMAPEQLRTGAADARTDIFGLGVVLYECATLKRLFGRSKFLESSDAVLGFEPPPLTECVPNFPSALAEIIHRCLAKDPAQRFQTPHELSVAFTEFIRANGGTSSATNQLASTIRANFPADSFDVRARAREAEHDTAVGPGHEDTDTTLSGGTGTTNRWEACAAVGSENPLDPEAIAQVAKALQDTRPGFDQRPPIGGVGGLWTQAKSSLHVYLELRTWKSYLGVGLIALGFLVIVAVILSACSSSAPAGPDAGSGDATAGMDAAAGMDAGNSTTGASLGILQFHVQHNLADDSCLGRSDCHLGFEEPAASLGPWLDAIGDASTQAVLHYDRAIPWDVFSTANPAGSDPVAYYDAQLDPELAAYFQTFLPHFGRFEQRYLAVSMLSGNRDRVAPLRRPDGTEVLSPVACPTFSATVSLSFGPNLPTIAVEETYIRFLKYLAAKFHPTRMALLVEANLFRKFCPAAWPGLASTYARLHDALRAELGPTVQLFATLTWPELLGYDGNRCNTFRFGPCDGSPLPAAVPPDPGLCFPMDLAPMQDLDAGDRLDVLALSFYPDGLSMNPPGLPEAELRFYPKTSDGQGTCSNAARLPPLIDPFEPLAHLPWTKPIAIAEWSARSCPTYLWIPQSPDPLVAAIDASQASQTWWMNRVFAVARAQHLAFVNQSFWADYLPIGTWMPRVGAIDATTYDIMNAWPCSGLVDVQGRSKSLPWPK